MRIFPLHRREFLKTAGATTLAAPWVWRQASAEDRRITMRDTGQGDVFSRYFYEDFKKATGITAVGIPAQAEPTGQIKTMVETRSYAWDMAVVSGPAAQQLGEQYLEPLGLEGTPEWAGLPDMYKSPRFAAINIVGVVLACRNEIAAAGMKNWADFWNVKAFPGRRCLRKFPFDSMEESEMAKGVPLSRVYPLDEDLVFRSLDEIKPHVDVWWYASPQSTQLVKAGELDIIGGLNMRIQAAIDDGAPFQILWNQFLWASQGWAILKGGPKVDLCREFIRFTLDPQRIGGFAAALSTGPTMPAAFKFIPEARAKTLPTYPGHVANSVEQSPAYWSANLPRLSKRFDQWLLS